jgi:hypothetical protein
MHDDAPGTPVKATVAPAQAQAPAPAELPATEAAGAQAQIDALSKQLADLKQTVSANGSVPADTPQAQ